MLFKAQNSKENSVSNFHLDIFKSIYRVSIWNTPVNDIWIQNFSIWIEEITSIHSPFLSNPVKESLTEISHRNNAACYCQWKLWVHTVKKTFEQSLLAAVTIYIQSYSNGIYRAVQIYTVVTKRNLVLCFTRPDLTAALCKMQMRWLQVF